MSGAGFGISGLRGLVGAISPNHRASVISAFYLAADVSLSVPAVLAGLVVNPLGLRVTLETFGLIAALIAVVVAASAGRTRPVAATAG